MSIALKIKATREKRGQLVTEAAGILKKADEEKRSMTAEEEKRFDAIHEDSDKLQAEIEVLEKQEQRAKWLEGEQARQHESTGRRSEPHRPGGGDPGGDAGGGEPGRRRGEEVRNLSWRLAASGGTRSVSIGGPRATDEYRDAYGSFLRGGRNGLTADEQRALTAGVSVDGGFLTAPMQMAADLIKAVDNMVFMRQLGSVEILTSAQSLGIPSLDADPDDAEWTSEVKAATEDTAMRFGRRELSPQPTSKLIKISKKLLRLTSGGAERLVLERLAYKFGITEEKAFLTGNGVKKPLGVFTASDDGIPTSRDVSEDNTTTAFTADGLINAKYALKGQYQLSPTTRWLFHRDAVKRIRKLKDGDGNYIWRAGLSADKGDAILEVPVLMSEYVPNTFTTGSYVGLIGDLRFYQIVDSLGLEIQRLDELYAVTNQVGFIARKETDGMPVLGEAFSRVALA